MRFIQKFADERFAKSASLFIEYVCFFMMIIIALGTVLSFMGRQTFTLHTKTGSFERAIYAEEEHAPHSRGMTAHISDDIHVWTDVSDQIDLTVHIGLSVMFAFSAVPMIFAFWFLSRVCSNIHKSEIFTEQNASYLLYYGLIQIVVSVFVPFVKLLICWLTNFVSDGRISISTGQDMLNTLIPGIAFIVAAYIIHYGVHLQDEVDHTL